MFYLFHLFPKLDLEIRLSLSKNVIKKELKTNTECIK